MITYLFGVPGAGKSYRAMLYALDYIGRDWTVLSNIEIKAQLDGYEYVNTQLYIELFAKIESVLTSTKTIDEYVDDLQRIISRNTLMIIDEAHFFGFADRKKEWLRLFLSIHRHLHIDLLIVTQTYKNIQTSHLDLGEVFIRSIPPSQRLLPNRLEYHHYSQFDAYRRLDKMFVTKKEVFRPDPEILALYESGANNQGTGGLRKKLYLLIAGIVALFAYVSYGFYSHFFTKHSASVSPSRSTLPVRSAEINGSVSDTNVSASRVCYHFCRLRNFSNYDYCPNFSSLARKYGAQKIFGPPENPLYAVNVCRPRSKKRIFKSKKKLRLHSRN
jgi:hypothetical protein